MKFEPTEEQIRVRQTIREFAEKELLPGVRERDENQTFPTEQVKKLGEMGFFGISIPQKYGGMGFDSICYAILIEELSRVEAGVGTIIAVNNSLFCLGIYKHGTEEQKQKYLVSVASGKVNGAYSLSEAGSGTDAASLKARITPNGDSYILNGTKMWVSNGASATYYIIFLTLDPSLGSKGICAVIIERGVPGFTVGKKEKKLGIRSSDTTELVFDNARIPKENLLGKEGEGFKIAMGMLDAGRISIAAQSVGIAQGALEAALRYAKERTQFGKPLIEHQTVQNKLAEMATAVDAGRLLTYRASYLKDMGEPFGMEASMAKLYSAPMANMVADYAVQIHGGYGSLQDYSVERFLRDARITEIYEGTSEVQRIVIARYLKNL